MDLWTLSNTNHRVHDVHVLRPGLRGNPKRDEAIHYIVVDGSVWFIPNEIIKFLDCNDIDPNMKFIEHIDSGICNYTYQDPDGQYDHMPLINVIEIRRYVGLVSGYLSFLTANANTGKLINKCTYQRIGIQKLAKPLYMRMAKYGLMYKAMVY